MFAIAGQSNFISTGYCLVYRVVCLSIVKDELF